MSNETEAPKSMADLIPGWGDILDGIAKACEAADPIGWQKLVEACEQQAAAQGMEARQGGDEGSVHDSPAHAPETGLENSRVTD